MHRGGSLRIQSSTRGGDGACADEELPRGCLLIVMASPANSEPAVPVEAPVLVYRYARSEPMPTDAIPVPDVVMPANMPFACHGADSKPRHHLQGTAAAHLEMCRAGGTVDARKP